MDSIRLKNFRCFREVKSARLAPLTLLVGENSTGKTSFLAMARILHEVSGKNLMPNFKQEPYDLGSFEEIAYHNKCYLSETFEAGFDAKLDTSNRKDTELDQYKVDVTFGKLGTSPVPTRRHFSLGNNWIEHITEGRRTHIQKVGTIRGEWIRDVSELFHETANIDNIFQTHFLGGLSLDMFNSATVLDEFSIISGDNDITQDDLDDLTKMYAYTVSALDTRPFAGAPVRSKPRRTYDPEPHQIDPEGNHIPMYLANIRLEDWDEWENIKANIEKFGQESGLFDEINIRNLGDRGSDPFQIQVRKSEDGDGTPFHNLIDVGYGVSQALPVVTQSIRDTFHSEFDLPQLFLLQQPEVHLHPRAQAALGSLFYELASQRNQIIVETHSDYLIDRVRMDVRDANGELKPEDVSILYFERNGAEVNIHSLGVDDNGNVTGAPNSYRRFFMEETKRRLWP